MVASSQSLFEKSFKSLKATDSIGGGSAPVINAQAIATLKGSYSVDATPSGSRWLLMIIVGHAPDAIKLIPCGDLKDFSNRL
jgi:hypothetical protein